MAEIVLHFFAPLLYILFSIFFLRKCFLLSPGWGLRFARALNEPLPPAPQVHTHTHTHTQVWLYLPPALGGVWGLSSVWQAVRPNIEASHYQLRPVGKGPNRGRLPTQPAPMACGATEGGRQGGGGCHQS